MWLRKNKMFWYWLVFFLTLNGMHEVVLGQSLRPRPMIGLGFGVQDYIGDLNTGTERFFRLYPGFNLNLQFDNYRRIFPQVNVGTGGFTAQNYLPAPIGVVPARFVRNDYFYFNLQLKMRLIKRRRVRPYVGSGIGVLSFTVVDEVGNRLNLKGDSRLPDEAYGESALVMVLNAGVNIRINRLVSVGIDLNRLLTNTDYLDNVSKLGSRPGNDRLQQLVVSVNLSIDNRTRRGRENRPIPPKPY